MSPFFSSEQLAHLSETTVRVDLLAKFEFASRPVYLWNGTTALETGGQTWQPLNGRATVDGIGIASGETSETVTATLDAIPGKNGDILALALEETPEVVQRLVTYFLQLFDADWQPVGAPIGIWWGFMQPPKVSRTPMQGAEGASQTIRLSAENAYYNRSRPPYGRYTDRDQQKRAPGDKFFQFAPGLVFKTFTYPAY